jgi:hypothetical protein
MQIFNRTADCKHYNFLKTIHSRIQSSEKHTEYANTTNNINNIKYSTIRQTQGHTPVIHGRIGLSYTPLDKVTDISVVYEDQFPSTPEEQTFDGLYQQIRREVATYLQPQPVNATSPSTPNQIVNVPKRMASDQDNFRNNNFRTLPLMPSHT